MIFIVYNTLFRLIRDAQASNSAAVLKMHSADLGLLVAVEIGVVFIFPPKSDEDENFVRWQNSRAIVVSNGKLLVHSLVIIYTYVAARKTINNFIIV